MTSANFKFHDIIVPTQESLRLEYLLKLFVSKNANLMIVGPTGTGKSVAGLNLMNSLDKRSYLSTTVALSAKSTANNLQMFIENKL